MSYTLYRISPSDRSGGPFDISYHGWHVLVRAIETFGPEEIVKKCLWRYNDEMGLAGDDAVRLADALDAALADGRVAAYIASNGHDPAAVNAVAELVDRASKENGIKLIMPKCELDVYILRLFIDFLRSCGGFWIG
jgi:hypothetical protein